MSFVFSNDTPIYLQIIEDIKIKIMRKQYKANDRLPSVRDLSMQYEVNPNTIQKALMELEDMGLIYTERTNGKYVTTDTTIIDSLTKSSVNTLIDDFYNTMRSMGLSKQDIINIIKSKE